MNVPFAQRKTFSQRSLAGKRGEVNGDDGKWNFDMAASQIISGPSSKID
jgi:hypothetical protein